MSTDCVAVSRGATVTDSACCISLFSATPEGDERVTFMWNIVSASLVFCMPRANSADRSLLIPQMMFPSWRAVCVFLATCTAPPPARSCSILCSLWLSICAA